MSDLHMGMVSILTYDDKCMTNVINVYSSCQRDMGEHVCLVDALYGLKWFAYRMRLET